MSLGQVLWFALSRKQDTTPACITQRTQHSLWRPTKVKGRLCYNFKIRDDRDTGGSVSSCQYCKKIRLFIRLVMQEKHWKTKMPWFLVSLFAAGAVLGPALDGIHGRFHLLTYDSAQFYLGGVQSSGWVALLLGSFYAVIGSLHIFGDHWQADRKPQGGQELYAKQSVPFVMASIRYS